MRKTIASWQAKVNKSIELDSFDRHYDWPIAVLVAVIAGRLPITLLSSHLPRFALLAIGWAVFVAVTWAVLRLLRRSPREHQPPVTFPPPPSDRWERSADLYSRDMGNRLLGQAFILVLIPPALAGIAITSAPSHTTWANYTLVAAVAMAFVLPVVAWFFLKPVHAHVKQMFRDEWFKSLREITSPVASRAAELSDLAAELQKRAASAEGIVLEVETLMRELEVEVAKRQGEYSDLLRITAEERDLSKIEQAKVDAVLSEWLKRHATERDKDRHLTVWVGIVGVVAGYIAAAVVSPDTLHTLLFRW